jgi:hypothetical protein
MSEPSTETAASDAPAPTTTRTRTQPAAPPPVSQEPATSSALPAGLAATAAEFTRTETVTAVQYVAPDGADEAGNIAQIEALGLEVDKQDPWDPAAGQNCLLVGYPPAEGELTVRTLLQPGQLVVLRTDANAFEVHDPDEFKQQFTTKQ